jgi:hypothetical protein
MHVLLENALRLLPTNTLYPTVALRILGFHLAGRFLNTDATWNDRQVLPLDQRFANVRPSHSCERRDDQMVV